MNKTLHLDSEKTHLILKNKNPYVFIDSADVIPGKEAFARRFFPKDEWFFDCHFPNDPIVPGVFLLEAIMQSAALAIYLTDEEKIDFIYANKMLKVECGKAVRPEDTIMVEAKILSFKRGIVKAEGIAFLEDKGKKMVVCKAQFQQLVPSILSKLSPQEKRNV